MTTPSGIAVVPEVMARVEGQENSFALPLTGAVDTHPGASMPDWPQVDAALRDSWPERRTQGGEHGGNAGLAPDRDGQPSAEQMIIAMAW
ncbi:MULTISPECIES: hypothetical protein [Micromonospora]|uniref:hypothetical protein n=1 Tax=Micromonospora TaxID=1873 RepID=UPI0004BF5B52|nr:MULTISPECIES: hypothetical protein [Micromonospora]